MYKDGDINDIGFFNNNVPSGVLPPLTGWQLNPPNGCLTGTMTVSYNLSNQDFEKSNFSIYPNPATTFLKIKSDNEFFNYQILDLNGRIISNGTTIETIDITELRSGIYFLKSETNVLKFIKL